MIRRDRCTCGARYSTFRVKGLTFASTKQSLYRGPDPELWVDKSKPAVLREMARIKSERWEEIHRHCPDTFDVVSGTAPDNVIPFRTQAGAKAFARMKARAERRPVTVDVRAGDSVIEAWEGDWRGRIRRAA